jgi:hypothetical protein
MPGRNRHVDSRVALQGSMRRRRPGARPARTCAGRSMDQTLLNMPRSCLSSRSCSSTRMSLVGVSSRGTKLMTSSSTALFTEYFTCTYILTRSSRLSRAVTAVSTCPCRRMDRSKAPAAINRAIEHLRPFQSATDTAEMLSELQEMQRYIT